MDTWKSYFKPGTWLKRCYNRRVYMAFQAATVLFIHLIWPLSPLQTCPLGLSSHMHTEVHCCAAPPGVLLEHLGFFSTSLLRNICCIHIVKAEGHTPL